MQQKISIWSKAGFHTPGPITIKDSRGVFLHYDNPTFFNLPAGDYEVSEGVATMLLDENKQSRFVHYDKIPYPAKQKDIDVKGVRVVVGTGHNPNKCTIDVTAGKVVPILMDREIEKKLTTPELNFLFFHELGHFFYTDENYCDIVAANKMLEKGFNPRQIAEASKNTLCNFGESWERKVETKDHMKNVAKNAA